MTVFANTAFADFSSTAVISFTIPTGYQLTSVHGWTDPAVTAVPEPAPFILFTVGLLGLGALRRLAPT